MTGSRPPFIRADLFGGRGTVRIWDLLASAAAPPFSAVLQCELAPGGTVGAHRQQDDPEIVIGLEGVGEARVDGQPQPLNAGDLVYLPHGSLLELANLGDAPLRYLIIKAKAG